MASFNRVMLMGNLERLQRLLLVTRHRFKRLG